MKKPSKRYIWSTYVSPYIRQKFADYRGYVGCITCGRIFHWKQIDCGHFLPKSRGDAIYFEEDNLYSQCSACNRFGSNDTGYKFGEAVKKLIGEKRFNRLFKLQRQTKRFTAKQLIAIKDYYKKKLEN